MTIFEFADVIGAELLVRRYPNQNGRWTAQFEHCEKKDGVCLVGAYGNDTTPAEAIVAYAQEIGGAKLVFNASSESHRREYFAPRGLVLE